MLSRIKSYGLIGLNGYAVTVEIDVSGGMPAYETVGLPDAAVRESKERVRAAIKNSGFTYPIGRITVNLAGGHAKGRLLLRFADSDRPANRNRADRSAASGRIHVPWRTGAGRNGAQHTGRAADGDRCI